MATTLPFVFAPEDEKRLFEFLARYELTVYPEVIPPDWVAPKLGPDLAGELEEEGYYLAAEGLGPLDLRIIKRGRKAGSLEIDETQSPVMHYARSVFDEEGALCSGRLWTWLDLHGDARKTPAFPEGYRRIWMAMREMLLKWHRSQPNGWVVGPHAARLHKAGTVLRESGHKGVVIRPYK